jgi:5-methylcytosine-specific restriction endonuclease McrA
MARRHYRRLAAFNTQIDVMCHLVDETTVASLNAAKLLAELRRRDGTVGGVTAPGIRGMTSMATTATTANGRKADMPYQAPRVCARCSGVVSAGQRCGCRKPWEGSPQRAARGRRWAQFRLARLRANPICQWIEKDGTPCRLVASTIDHIRPLAENGAEYSWDNTQSLCARHAVAKNTQDALRGKRRRRGNGPSDPESDSER